MKKDRLALAISLLGLGSILFLAIQALLLIQRFQLERNRFTFFSQQYVASAFFQAATDYPKLARFVEELRENRQARTDTGFIRDRLRSILADYAFTGERIRERYARDQMAADFHSAIMISDFILSPGARTASTVIQGNRPQDELLLFGDLEGFTREEMNSTFFLTNSSYYIQIKVYIRHVRPTKFLLGRITGFLAISSITMLIVLTIFSFTVLTLLRQKKITEVRRDFVTHVSHELKTPLGTTSVALSLIREKIGETAPPELREPIEVIHRQIQRLNLLVQRTLEIIATERSAPALKLARQAAHPLLKTIFQDFAFRTREHRVSTTLNLDAGNDVVILDEFQFTTAVQNILDNAVKYSPTQPRVELTTSSDRQQLTISLTDNGIGIKKRDQKRIFEQFVRLPADPSLDAKGLGLGLFFSSSIIKAHGGRIICRSKWGQGSTFQVILPLAETGDG